MSYVVWFDDAEPDAKIDTAGAKDKTRLASRVGGKCVALAEMTAAGLPVPPGFAITVDAQGAACRQLEPELRRLLASCDPDDEPGLARTSSTMRSLVEANSVPEDLRAEVAAAYAELCRRSGIDDVPVAVRSSATGEDAPEASFAGEFETLLWVRGTAEVLAALRRCWASLFTERAIAYRHRIGLPDEIMTMAVAVQQMVPAYVAGVAFTLNPENGDRSEIAIEASWGFGEAVVAGEVNPDGYLVDKVLLEITRRKVSDKATEYRLGADGRRLLRTEVPEERRRVPCLSDEEIGSVARLALRAEQHYGVPLDVEWAMDTDPAGGHRVWLLQCRPETVWSRRQAARVAPGEPSGYRAVVSTLLPHAAPKPPAEEGAGRARLPSPFEVGTPAGAEGWEELYAYPSVFSQERREYDGNAFWFRDSVHWPTPLPPWDATFFEYAMATLSQFNTRHYIIPAALGIDYRILNGYAYLAPVTVVDPELVQERGVQFLERAGFYFSNWDDLYAKWLEKVRALVGEIQQIRFDPLPDAEEMAVITEGRGTGSGLALVQNYRALLDLCLTLWMYHFEFLNLGYAAYLDFFRFCRTEFPGIPEQSIARMVAGVEVDLFRPDDELKNLARLAVELGVDAVFADAQSPDVLDDRLRATAEGRRWRAAWEAVSEPWFNFSAGSGFYHSDPIWIEHREIPYDFVRDYAARIRRGDDVARPLAQLHAERDRITAEYAALMPTDADRAAFEEKLRLTRVVFPYVENHNFYIEHWAHSVIWRKMRELGRLLVAAEFLAEENEVFFLRRNEIPDVLWDLYSSWAVGAQARGPAYWPGEIQRRKDILDVLARNPPPPALGTPPKVVTEPFTIMLWGITEESIAQWLSPPDDDGDMRGMAASPGLAEGPARVISGPHEIDQVREGEILVAPLTAPSWAPIFSRIRATVTDIGGIMSHAAIVCREYGLPAVTGTATATQRIRTGQRIRVDGDSGRVTVLDERSRPGFAAQTTRESR
jgi:pyruvate, water dikinase